MKPLYYSLVAIFLLFSAFFSMADMVYGVVDRKKLEKDATSGNKKAKLALKLAEDYEFSISAILFGNNLANIFASSFTTLLGMAHNHDDFQSGELIATIILTIVVILFCEFVPKAIGKRFSYPLSKAFAYPVEFFKGLSFIFVYPVSKGFAKLAKLFAKRKKEEDTIDEDVIDQMIDAIEEEGIVAERQADLLHEAIDFSDIEAYEIMTPRVDVKALDVDDDIYEAIENEGILEYSRIPVYEDTIDNIIGFLPIKALSKYIYKREKVDIRSLLLQPIRVPRNRQILDLLKEFKKTKIHMAVVIDEYGGTEGIITMEDILEELVGDIFDETDDIEEEFVDRKNGVYLVRGSMNVDDVFERIGIDEDEDIETGYATIGGFCQGILDRFAKKGDEFTILDRFKFEIIEADEYTVERLRITDLRFEPEER